MYHILLKAATPSSESLTEFLQSGRAESIKKDILRFLSDNPNESYTALQLQRLVGVSFRSSVCKPLWDLVDLNLIEVVGVQYDKETNREVGLYQVSKSLFS